MHRLTVRGATCATVMAAVASATLLATGGDSGTPRRFEIDASGGDARVGDRSDRDARDGDGRQGDADAVGPAPTLAPTSAGLHERGLADPTAAASGTGLRR